MFALLKGKSLLFVAIVVALIVASFGSHIPGLSTLFSQQESLTVSSSRNSGALIGKKQYTVAMPADGEYADLDDGKEQWFAIGALKEVSEDLRSNGMAQAHLYQSKVYRISVQLNVEQASDNQFYEAWLLNADSGNRFSLGRLKSRFDDSRHFLQFEANRDLTRYETVEVTLEDDNDNSEQGSAVARGTLTFRER